MIPVGALVTLLIEKSFPGLGTINAGISGMVVGHTRATGGLLHIIDFGPEGQWNCIESELRQESRVRQEDISIDDAEEDDDDEEEDDPPTYYGPRTGDQSRVGSDLGADGPIERMFRNIPIEPERGTLQWQDLQAAELPIPPEPKLKLSSFEEDLARMEKSKSR